MHELKRSQITGQGAYPSTQRTISAFVALWQLPLADEYSPESWRSQIAVFEERHTVRHT